MAAVPWTDITIDLLSELPTVLGKSAVLVVLDRFFKLLRLLSLGGQTDTESVWLRHFSTMWCVFIVYHTLLYQIAMRGLWDNSYLMSAMGTKLMFSHCASSSNTWIE